MKTRETIDAVGFVVVAGASTAGVAAPGIVRVAAAGVDFLIVTPFRGARTVKAKAPVAARKQRIERHFRRRLKLQVGP